MGMYNKSQFVFSETFNNGDGKTSGSGFIGVVLGLISGAAFIGAMVGYYLNLPNTLEVMGEILKLAAASTILLGVRKVSGQVGQALTPTPTPTQTPPPDSGTTEKG